MTSSHLNDVLDQLIADWESEVVEFKEAGNDYDTRKIGQYFSALSNEANLRGLERAWLIFGVNDKTRSVTNTNYREDPERLQSTKMQISDGTEPSITFRNIDAFTHTSGGRVVMFEIPAAPLGMPISWNGHYYARSNESLVGLDVSKLDEIRNQTQDTDWSAQVVPTATLDHLDPNAISKAREFFAQKHANRFDQKEVAQWSDETFLDRARITQEGRVTRTALLLLGKAESAHLLSPHPAQMTWKLEGPERAYEHFAPPFLLSSTALYRRIRNIQMRILPDDELLPIEVSKYDREIVLEALHNCIAHQDYTRNGRIIVTEWPDKLTFENEGSFFEGQPDDYVEGKITPRRYRNPFLTQAMAELNMIDTMGYGIHRMNVGQARRYFPLPDYAIGEDNVVRMTIYGGVVDPAYSKLLLQKTDLPLADILALDRVQKGLAIPEDRIRRLRQAKLIEGRKPKFRVSVYVAAATSSKADYIRTRGLDDKHYKSLILEYIEKFGEASRQEVNDFLSPKLSEVLNEKQKIKKISNLLSNMRRAGSIVNTGSKAKPCWKIAERK